ncbi:HAD family hydrolase [Vibrio lentus]
MKKLVITDLDNTLYDWVSFYASSFKAMLDELEVTTGISRDVLLADFKLIHQKHGNAEQPWAILELPSLFKHYKTDDRRLLKEKVDPALHAFNRARLKHLRCYDGVIETLQSLKDQNITLVAHTEAPARNALYRLEKLGLKRFFSHLYTPKDRFHHVLDEKSVNWLDRQGDFLQLLEENERKPNPHLLRLICEKESVDPRNALYIGDSIVKDIAMANAAGATSVWAEYGKQHNPDFWKILVSITHWTDEDVKREEQLKEALSDTKPAFVASEFSDLLKYL